MTRQDEAQKLIKKLSRERHGGSQLTADVYEFLGHEIIRTPRSPHGVAFRYLRDSRWLSMNRLTEDTDDAMRLAREHGANSISTQTLYGRGSKNTARATVYISTPEQYHGLAATPALAICIGVVKSIVGEP